MKSSRIGAAFLSLALTSQSLVLPIYAQEWQPSDEEFEETTGAITRNSKDFRDLEKTVDGAIDGIVTEGNIGSTCQWTLSENGVLTIHAGTIDNAAGKMYG